MVIQNVLLVGAGWTGRQIAGQMAAHGVNVVLVDQNLPALSDARNWICNQRPTLIANHAWPNVSEEELLERIQLGESSADEGPIDLVLECVSEQFSLKRRLLQQYSRRFAAPTILASNSSYFTPSMFGQHIESPERFAHFHFHVPIWIATLVDIVPFPDADSSTVDALVQLANRIGQKPLVQQVENPGYVFNWMLKALLQSALQLVDREVASPQDIDMAWKKVTGMPIGPFGMMDQIGIDLIHQTMSHARFVDGDDVWQPLIDILQPYVDKNQLGVKTGKGFFEHAIGRINHTQSS